MFDVKSLDDQVKDLLLTKITRGKPLLDENQYAEGLSNTKFIYAYESDNFLVLLPLPLYECQNCKEQSYIGVPYYSCGNCNSVYYCSKKCQKSDWKNHKLWCTPIVEETMRVLNSIVYGLIDDDYPLFNQLKNHLRTLFAMNQGLGYELKFSYWTAKKSKIDAINNGNIRYVIHNFDKLVHPLKIGVTIKLTICRDGLRGKEVSRTIIFCRLNSEKEITYTDIIKSSMLLVLLTSVLITFMIWVNYLPELVILPLLPIYGYVLYKFIREKIRNCNK